MKQSLYIDTNVFFAVESSENEFVRSNSKILFDALFQDEYSVVSSSLVASELLHQSGLAIKCWDKIFPKMNLVEINDAAISLAKYYVDTEVVTPSEYLVALHVATATVHRCNYFVSWNYNTILKNRKVRQYIAVNQLMGYPSIHFCSPAQC